MTIKALEDNEQFWKEFAEDDPDEVEEEDPFQVTKEQALDFITNAGAEGAHNEDMLEYYNEGFDRNKISHMGNIEGLADLQSSGVIERRGDRWYIVSSSQEAQLPQSFTSMSSQDFLTSLSKYASAIRSPASFPISMSLG